MNIHYLAQRKIKFDFAISGYHNLKHFTHLTWKKKYIAVKMFQLTLKLPCQICNSPYSQPYNYYNISSENLVLDQLIIPKFIFFFILITCLVNVVLIL